MLTGHFVIGTPVQQTTCAGLAHTSPLLEEKRDALLTALAVY